MAKAQSKADTTLADKQPVSLSLAPRTIASLKAALSNPTERLLAIMNNPQLSPQQKQQMIKDISAGGQRTIDSLLTPEQKRLFLQQAAARAATYRQTPGDSTKFNH